MASKDNASPSTNRSKDPPPNSNKRPRADNRRRVSEKKKRLASSIKTITDVDLDSSLEEENMNNEEANNPENATFKVQKPPATTPGTSIAFDDLEKILDKRFSDLATA